MSEVCRHWRIMIEPVEMFGASENYINAVTATCCDCGKTAKMTTDWREGAPPDQVEVLRLLLADGAVFVPTQFEHPVGRTIEEWRENISKTALYQRGDTVLVWVNEGDLYPDGLYAKHYSPPEPS